MTSRAQRPFQPSFERFEDRLVPTGNVVASVNGNILTLTGDVQGNQLLINQIGLNQFLITGVNTGVNGVQNGSFVAANVSILNASMFAGDDSIVFNTNNAPMLWNDIFIDGGLGNNTVQGTNMALIENLTVVNSFGNDQNKFTNLSVGGQVKFDNGDGDTTNSITRTASGFNSIGVGGLRITNGVGFDQNTVLDTNSKGNVVITNGNGNAGTNQGAIDFLEVSLNASQQTVDGNVSFSTISGHVTDVVDDTNVQGNVTYRYGSGQATESLGANRLFAVPTIGGNVRIRGSGPASVFIGNDALDSHHGVNISGGVTIGTGGGDDAVTFTDAQVKGSTAVQTSAGNDTVTIDTGRSAVGSTFGGNVFIGTSEGSDVVNIRATGTTTTTFQSHLHVDLGPSNDTLNLALSSKVFLNAAAPALFDGGTGTDALNVVLGNLVAVSPPLFVNFP